VGDEARVMQAPGGYTPLESPEPVRGFAIVRLELALCGLLAAAVLDFEGNGLLALLLLLIFLPLAIVILIIAQRSPQAALNPVVAVIDLVSLAVIMALVPASYAAVQFCALVLVLAYPLVRGELRGALFAGLAVVVLVPIAFLSDPPVENERLAFYELIFAVCAITGAVFTGRIAASESLARRRARELTRRIIEAGYEARRDVAQSLHDGPVQELVSADMKVTGAMNAAARGDNERTQMLLDDAREIIERNVGALRNELIALGPVAFDELSFQEAVEQCAPAWGRRYEIDVRTHMAPLDMPNEMCGALFGIAQEAVANAGRHGGAGRVDLTLTAENGLVELAIVDDGRGFGDVSPLGSREPGHLGLASMRERAEIVGGRLAIESSDSGTAVRVLVPASRVG
jgi:two-component system, NarL family, sensor kinase